jgi:hypothetical protein
MSADQRTVTPWANTERGATTAAHLFTKDLIRGCALPALYFKPTAKMAGIQTNKKRLSCRFIARSSCSDPRLDPQSACLRLSVVDTANFLSPCGVSIAG